MGVLGGVRWHPGSWDWVQEGLGCVGVDWGAQRGWGAGKGPLALGITEGGVWMQLGWVLGGVWWHPGSWDWVQEGLGCMGEDWGAPRV